MTLIQVLAVVSLLLCLATGQNILGKAGVVSTYKGTVGGGKPCYFPFMFKGKIYSSCIMAEHDKPWCATTSNYDVDKLWGNCVDILQTAVIAAKSNGGSSHCIFPFIYNGVNHTECIYRADARPWCATTANYDTDQMRGDCQIYTVKDIQTFGGTAAGQSCALPYLYNGAYKYGCIMNDFNRLWCSTTENYDSDRKWGICVEDSQVVGTKLGNANGANCVFPFIYEGVLRSGCIPDDNPKLWCATTDNYDVSKQWGRCILYSPVVATRNGNSFGRQCNFPFKFEGTDYYGCITSSGRGNPWCGTLRDYDATLAWGECIIPSTSATVYTFRGTANGAKCKFPFIFNGKTYYNCISEDTEDPWCSTTTNYATDKLWGFCISY